MIRSRIIRIWSIDCDYVTLVLELLEEVHLTYLMARQVIAWLEIFKWLDRAEVDWALSKVDRTKQVKT